MPDKYTTPVHDHIDALTLAESYLDEAEALLLTIYQIEVNAGRRHSQAATLAGIGQRVTEEAGSVFADQIEALIAQRKGGAA